VINLLTVYIAKHSENKKDQIRTRLTVYPNSSSLPAEMGQIPRLFFSSDQDP